MIFDLPCFGELAPLIHLKELPLAVLESLQGRLVFRRKVWRPAH